MHGPTVIVLALAITSVAAARSTWSPCTLSMLSTVTPLGETGRGHRYLVTVAWFIAGAGIGGACLGVVMAALAIVMHGLSLSPHAVAIVVVATAIVTIASDSRVGGFTLPRIARQVDEAWLNRYRGWVYGLAFGWQIGVGFTTYVMTAAVYLMVVLGALTANPTAALALGVGFGLVRGAVVLLGWRLTTPDSVRLLHRRLDAVAPWSLRVAVAVQSVVLVVVAVANGRLVALCAAGGVAALALAYVSISGARHARRRTEPRVVAPI